MVCVGGRTMNRFKIGDKVIVKATKGGSNEVLVVKYEYEFNVTGSFITMQAVELSDGSTALSGNLELWCPKKDLNGEYKWVA